MEQQALSVRIDDVSVERLATQSAAYKFIIPVNVDVLLTLNENQRLRSLVERERCRICLPLDSQVLKCAVRCFLHQRFSAVCRGADFFNYFWSHQPEPGHRFFLLGGRPGAAERAAARINAMAERNIVVGSDCPPQGFEGDSTMCRAVVEKINGSAATCLVVGLGCPKQEFFILERHDQMRRISLFLAVGAAIDFEAGIARRAPRFVRRTGMEWFFRMCLEPRRLARRYLVRDMAVFRLLLSQRSGVKGLIALQPQPSQGAGAPREYQEAGEGGLNGSSKHLV